MKAPIQIHPEWEDIEVWFKRRVAELGLTDYQVFAHIEQLAIEYTIDQAVLKDALELGFAGRRLNVEDSGVAKGKVKAAGNDEKKGRAREKAQAEYTPSGVTPTSPRTHEVELTDAEKRLAHGGWTTEQILRRRKKP
jgi:hypothetical protein